MTLIQEDVLGTASGTVPTRGRGRWLQGYDPEDRAQWEAGGRAIARRNLWWSILTEFLGFVVWQLWAITVVFLPAAGFELSVSQSFWLISLPSLVGATLRIPYTFMVGRFGGRNWTVVSGLLLLLPAVGLGLAVSNPDTPFWVLLLVAATAGFGGGNFASSMANISFFFPAREKGWALGLNAAGGNLGAAVAQLAVPLVISVGAAGALRLPMAGWVWVPLVLLAALGAWWRMDNLSDARSDVAGSLAAVRQPHFWILALLYVGTFGSFIGFSAVFPKLIADTYPQYSTFALGAASLSLSFLGPLVGSLARPWGGRLADRLGGARMTVGAFAAMSALALCVVWTLPLRNFWLFLGLFLLLFVASGLGNGATYKMIPTVYGLRGRAHLAAPALGLVSAVGGYGGFIIPQVLSAAKQTTGGYEPAFLGFVGYYLAAMVLCWAVYLRRDGAMAAQRV
ncbi:NarK/NasA family nitrate transporter [Tessaracoccus rhinocerotis]|uniref:NarK/NasA family nitrate transporter n=1 Tax=Tessaracoccus rhinocerotis TaxID=1689449 RepID=A0A553K1K4_9ACTN|nr:nitrate/nitrite transporter [Tessaracoccus rhinocerotis]TRY18582.1 NarK/NasA family nitrate transporter [Tessaracoccus rhinocerotis]